ncbi:unnamed protein product, partial [marine sediment metagenome]
MDKSQKRDKEKNMLIEELYKQIGELKVELDWLKKKSRLVTKKKTVKRCIGIVGTGSYLPKKVITNRDLEKTLDTSDEWIYSKVGVRTRRIAAPDEATSDLGAKAAIKAMKDAQVQPCDVDLIILATSSPDMIQPSTACIVQDK